MPNFICEELVYKDGKVDIVEEEFSKLWNDKIKRLEAENKELKRLNMKAPNEGFRLALEEENKKLKEENEKLNDMWAKKRDEDGDSYRIIINELKDDYNELLEKYQIMETTWLCQEDVDEIIFRQTKEIKTMKTKCLKSVSKLNKKIKELQKEIDNFQEDVCPDDNEQPVIPEAKADSIRDEYEKLSSGEYWNKSNNRIYDRPGRNIEGAMVFKNDRWVKYYC